MNNIEFTKNENILNCENAIILIPVNTVGVMGKGLALECKTKFPSVFKEYKELCDDNELKVGKIILIDFRHEDFCDRTFCLFPTKEHWKNPSKLEYIDKGMDDLLNIIDCGEYFDFERTICIPKLGCGLGSLNWEKDVKPLIINKINNSGLIGVEFIIFE